MVLRFTEVNQPRGVYQIPNIRQCVHAVYVPLTFETLVATIEIDREYYYICDDMWGDLFLSRVLIERNCELMYDIWQTMYLAGYIY